MTQTVLVLGRAGQLGSAFMRRSGEYGLDAAGLVRAEFDAEKQTVWETLPRLGRFDALINCIAFHKVDQCEEDPARAFHVNAELVRQLTLYCRQSDMTFVHISTDYVFDGTQRTPYREDDEPAPLNVYGISKLAGEQAVRAYGDAWYVVRTQSLFGHAVRQDPQVNFVEKMIDAARRREPLRVIDNQFICPTYADDVARAVCALLRDGSAPAGIYHACSRGECSWYEFARRIFALTGLNNDLSPVPYDQFHTRARRPQYTTMDNIKLSRYFAFAAWPEALEEYLRAAGHLANQKGASP